MRKRFLKTLGLLGIGLGLISGLVHLPAVSILRPASPWLSRTAKDESLWQAGWQLIKPVSAQTSSKSVVVVVRNSRIREKDNTLNGLQIKRSLNLALRTLTDKDSAKEALQEFIGPKDIVGLKVNTFLGKRANATRSDLAYALADFIRQTGVPENNVIIWDRAQDELEGAGYKINRSRQGIRCLATLTARPPKRNSTILMGYDNQEITILGNFKTRLSNILSKFCTVNINLPVLRTHKFKEDTGINNAIMNMYHAIEITDENRKVLYDNQCDPGAAGIYALPTIKNKTKLVICDALSPLYNGGPFEDPRYHWDYNGIIVGFDPVAVDIVGLKILQEYRIKHGNPKWLPLEPGYLLTCAGLKYQLGNADLNRIKLIEKNLD